MPLVSANPLAVSLGPNPLHPWEFHGSNGDDVITTLGIDDVVYAGDGADTVHAGGGNDVVYGEAGNDTLFGENGNDTLYGGAGIDRLFGGEGNDILDGGIGDDFLDGGTGHDQLSGGDGNDTLVGRTATILNGGAGDDLIFRGDGGTTIDGGDGTDELRMSAYDGAPLPSCYTADVDLAANSAEIVAPGTVCATNTIVNVENVVGLDQTEGGFGDALRGDAADNHIWGLGGNDLIDGRDGNDVLDGGTGNDELFGGTGDDVLIGGDGNDWLHGGAGIDHMTGGAGRDYFVFDNGDAALRMSWGVLSTDTIDDFHRGEDRIDLHLIDANSHLAGDQSFSLVSHFTGTPGEIVIGQDYTYSAWNALTGSSAYQPLDGSFVFGDTDGDGTADLMIDVRHVTGLTAGDFIL
jgi:Ca2+-binding RTX toxin-like protein